MLRSIGDGAFSAFSASMTFCAIALSLCQSHVLDRPLSPTERTLTSGSARKLANVASFLSNCLSPKSAPHLSHEYMLFFLLGLSESPADSSILAPQSASSCLAVLTTSGSFVGSLMPIVPAGFAGPVSLTAPEPFSTILSAGWLSFFFPQPAKSTAASDGAIHTHLFVIGPVPYQAMEASGPRNGRVTT